MLDASRIHLSRWQSFAVGAVGGWGLLASIATMALGPSVWTGMLPMRPLAMQCGPLTTAEELHRAATQVPGWAGGTNVDPQCIAVPRHPLPPGHLVQPEDLVQVYVGPAVEGEGLLVDGGVGERLGVPVSAHEPIFRTTLVAQRRFSKPLAPMVKP